MEEYTMSLGCYGLASIAVSPNKNKIMYIACWIYKIPPPLLKEKHRYLCITTYGMDFLYYSEKGIWQHDDNMQAKGDSVIAWLYEPTFKENKIDDSEIEQPNQ